MDLHLAGWDYHFRTKAGFRVQGIANASLLREEERHGVLSFYNRVASEIWIMPADWFLEIGAGLFPADASIFLVTDVEEPVGFSIVKRLRIRGRRVLFGWFTNVRPCYQKMGTLDSITCFLVNRELTDGEGLPPYSFRTRNPVRWRAAARMMTRVAPDFIGGTHDQELYQLARHVAGHVYPGSRFDQETLAMPDAYPPGSGYQAPYHLNDQTVDRAFYAHPAIANPNGGLITVGELNAELIRERIKDASF
jgi:hypothetical protein